MRIASLIQDLVMLPLRFVASLRPLGSKANTIVDMVTSENVGLTQIHQEIFTNNINNITKLALVGTAGAGGLMVVCFMVAVAALVLTRPVCDSSVLVPSDAGRVWHPQVKADG